MTQVWPSSTVGHWQVYDTDNSGLPSNNARSLAVDFQGNVWIGTGEAGVAKFDGRSWQVYDTDNFRLPSNNVSSLAVDFQGNVWMGTGGGVVRFDGRSWQVYDMGNSGLPSNDVWSLAVDFQENVWIGNDAGVAKFDGRSWQAYGTGYSGLPLHSVLSLAADFQGNVWMGTGGGVVRFDGRSWQVYDTDNSGLPSNVARSLTVDAQGNLWIGTFREGLAVYREGRVILPGTTTAVTESDEASVPTVYWLAQNYPNPFNSDTVIRFALAQGGPVELVVYNLIGQKVVTLVDGMRPAGSPAVHWDGRDDAGNAVASGVYLYRLQAGTQVRVRKLVLVQ